MFEIYTTLFVAIVVWGIPLYKLIVKKKKVSKNDTIFAPFMYLITILTLANMEVDRAAYIFPGFLEKTVMYMLIMHIIVFVVISTLETMIVKNETDLK